MDGETICGEANGYLLRRLAEVCRDEVMDEMTDWEAVVRQHARLARIALGEDPELI